MFGIGLFRLLLALTVVITHTHSIWGFTLGNPVIAVRAFFIISGFYMTMILTEKYSKLISFYKNRILKIYPIYWTTLILTVLSCIGAYVIRKNWGEMYYLVNSLASLKPLEQILIISSQLVIFGRGLVQFSTYGDLMGIFFLLIPQAWTLVLELWFYLLIPFIFKKKLLVISLFIISILIKYSVAQHHPEDPLWLYRYFPAELCYFLLGWFSYNIYNRIRGNNINLGYFSVIATITLLSLFNYINIDLFIREWLFYIALIYLIPHIFHFSKNSKIDRNIGDLSYPVYITHILLNNMLNPILFVPLSLNRNLQPVLVFIASIIVSIFILRFIQDPIEKIRMAGVQ